MRGNQNNAEVTTDWVVTRALFQAGWFDYFAGRNVPESHEQEPGSWLYELGRLAAAYYKGRGGQSPQITQPIAETILIQGFNEGALR